MFKRSLLSLVLLTTISGSVFAEDNAGRSLPGQAVDFVVAKATALKNAVGNASGRTETAVGYGQRLSNSCSSARASVAAACSRVSEGFCSAGSTLVRLPGKGFNAWNESTTGGFVNAMFNPDRYLEACYDMHQAGIRSALPTLWQDHKPVITATALAATATLGVVAWYKGWFKKAQQKIDAYRK